MSTGGSQGPVFRATLPAPHRRGSGPSRPETEKRALAISAAGGCDLARTTAGSIRCRRPARQETSLSSRPRWRAPPSSPRPTKWSAWPGATPLDGILDSVERLKTFEVHNAVNLFDDYVRHFHSAPERAQTRALKAISALAGQNEAADLLLRIAGAMARAEGDISAEARARIDRIGRSLGIETPQAGGAAAATPLRWCRAKPPSDCDRAGQREGRYRQVDHGDAPRRRPGRGRAQGRLPGPGRPPGDADPLRDQPQGLRQEARAPGRHAGAPLYPALRGTGSPGGGARGDGALRGGADGVQGLPFHRDRHPGQRFPPLPPGPRLRRRPDHAAQRLLRRYRRTGPDRPRPARGDRAEPLHPHDRRAEQNAVWPRAARRSIGS